MKGLDGGLAMYRIEQCTNDVLEVGGEQGGLV